MAPRAQSEQRGVVVSLLRAEGRLAGEYRAMETKATRRMRIPFRENGARGAPSNETSANAQLNRLACLAADDVLAELGTERAGLTDSEAEARREQFGRNEVAHEKQPAWYVANGRRVSSNLLQQLSELVEGRVLWPANLEDLPA